MIHIIGKRGSGKTTALIRKAVEDKCVIVSRHPIYIKERASEIGISQQDIKVISISQFCTKLSTNSIAGSRTKYYVDEIDDVIRCMFKDVIAGVSVNVEDWDIGCISK